MPRPQCCLGWSIVDWVCFLIESFDSMSKEIRFDHLDFCDLSVQEE